jgi:hypothetical protein
VSAWSAAAAAPRAEGTLPASSLQPHLDHGGPLGDLVVPDDDHELGLPERGER